MARTLKIKFKSDQDLADFNVLFKTKYTFKTASHNLITGKQTFRNVKLKRWTETKLFTERVKQMEEFVKFEVREDKPICYIQFIMDDDQLPHFENKLGIEKLGKIRSVWFPHRAVKRCHRTTTHLEGHKDRRRQYPIYIVSKNRWQLDRAKTANYMVRNSINFYLVVEKDQEAQYRKNFPQANIIIIPQCYFDNYITLDDLGNTKSKGPGPARNYAWDHSLNSGHKKHWVMDDNITSFYGLWYNRTFKYENTGSVFFRMMEDFVDRFDNVKMAGPNYVFFIAEGQVYSPFVENTRIYSCNLISNDLKIRWRGRLNEDTVLSLDIIKLGHQTLQTNFLLQDKATTMTVKGGNFQDHYGPDGTKPKAELLVRAHPDCCKVIKKYNRWHHEVDYKKFYKKFHLREFRDDFKYDGFKLLKNDTKEELDIKLVR